jgi:hypothetical protein
MDGMQRTHGCHRLSSSWRIPRAPVPLITNDSRVMVGRVAADCGEHLTAEQHLGLPAGSAASSPSGISSLLMASPTSLSHF